MTATPIPRTLALTEYGDLDVTRLRELPRGRRPIATHVVASPAARARAYERVREELRAGRQAYVVCPLVEESEQLQARAASVEFERLRAGELRDFEVELLHGQLRPREKQAAMARFAAGEAQVLVATTVIEVGLDVPNATVMLVEDAERYGISQLHQLRGRIGRGEHPSVCLLMGTRRRIARACRRWPRTATASRWPRSTCSYAARASWPGCASTALRAPDREPAAGRRAFGARARVGAAAARRGPRAGRARARACSARRWSARSAWRHTSRSPREACDRGQLGGRRLHAPRGRARRGRPPSACARRCSRCSASSEGSSCSTSSQVPARSRSRRSRAAPRGPCWLSATPRALVALRANLTALGIGEDTAEVRRGEALRALRTARERSETYDLIFVDPPYSHAGVLERELVAALPPLLAPRARVVVESDRARSRWSSACRSSCSGATAIP